MEKDTVLLSIEEYNKLRDFKNNTLDGKKYTVEGNAWRGETQIIFYTDNEIADIINKRNKDLNKDIDQAITQRDIYKEKLTTLQREYAKIELDHEITTIKLSVCEKSITKIKNMNLFQLVKWRVTNK